MTKEDFLKRIIDENGSCNFMDCQLCPYSDGTQHGVCEFSSDRVKITMAKLLLRTFPTKEGELERLKHELFNRDKKIHELEKLNRELNENITYLRDRLHKASARLKEE
jgi:hypothetical protein